MGKSRMKELRSRYDPPGRWFHRKGFKNERWSSQIEAFCRRVIIEFQTVPKKNMSFYYMLSSMMNSSMGMDQCQTYFPNFSNFGANNEELYNFSFFPINWTQPETFCNSEGLANAPTTVPAEDLPRQLPPPSPQPPAKRRIQKTVEKQIISAKKNSESNLINQFYSFFGSREKSEKIVEKCCALMKKSPEDFEKIVTLFYSAVRYINVKRGRKYVNAAMLLKFFLPDEFGAYLPQFKEKIESCDFLTFNELCELFRRCTVYFLKTISVPAILTSKRISLISKEEHLKKRRKVLRCVLDN